MAVADNGGAYTFTELCGIRHGWLMGHQHFSQQLEGLVVEFSW